jgi:hypothetical protein
MLSPRPLLNAWRAADQPHINQSGRGWRAGMGEEGAAERQRLAEADHGGIRWRRWGPYLSERQWGTVREDFGGGHDSWSAFTHEQARSRAYRWGEDGLAGVCDDKQQLCLAIALWNERDPILKERLFGLTNAEGNHGEDVKECYYYLDATPTSSYLRMLYKYPQAEFPYASLVAVNGARGKSEPEYELLDTGVFNDGRYFDVEVEYAKGAPEDLLLQVTVHNRGPEDARVHVLPTLWFRHTWSWAGGDERPGLRATADADGRSVVCADYSELGTRWLRADGQVPVLVTENETNNERVFGLANPDGTGTKAALHYVLDVPAGGSAVLRARMNDHDARHYENRDAFGDFGDILNARRHEASGFYAGLLTGLSDDQQLVCRQAFAGMLWSKQYYGLDIERWLQERGSDPLAGGTGLPNEEWRHLVADDIISMPDAWEYPWFAAWDLAFHAVPLAIVDATFAKQQLNLLLNSRYLHPNGQLPAYEWNFSDVNPPVHAWATWFVYDMEKMMTGQADRTFLENAFRKLARNFSWWLNRKDADGRNIFQGGFLGLDNIGVFDRSAPLPGGGRIDQADGTAWMALYCQTMIAMAVELAEENPAYLEDARSLTENCMFGGNSNWRGPVWFPINVMIIRALLRLYAYFGDELTVECPTGSGEHCTLYQVAEEITNRLTATFLRDPTGRRPVHGGQSLLQDDPHWRDLVLFYEYSHGDNGAGIGASHQTGWTGLVAVLPLLFRDITAESLRNQAIEMPV